MWDAGHFAAAQTAAMFRHRRYLQVVAADQAPLTRQARLELGRELRRRPVDLGRYDLDGSGGRLASTNVSKTTSVTWALGRAAERFPVLAEQAGQEQWSHVDYLAAVMAEQVAATTNRRLAARMRYTRFPYRRTIEEFDFDFQPSIDRKLVADLATLRFIVENRPVLFFGQPGCGKTHPAAAAVEAGYRGYFTSADGMAHGLVAARRDGTITNRLRTCTAPPCWSSMTSGSSPSPGGAAEIFHVIHTR